MQYKFLIYISYSYAIPIGNPLEQEILKRGYTVKWFSDLEEGRTALIGKNNTLNTIDKAIDYEPDIVLAATDDVPDFLSGIKVQIFHGFFAKKRPLKNGGYYHFRIRGFFDLYCTQGPSTTKEFSRLSKKLKHFEVIETGWSKVDPLFPLEEITNTPSRPTIMIASTFTERLSLALNEQVFAEIERLSKTNAFNFIMVLHPKLSNKIKQKWQALNNENFTYYDTTELIPLFKQSDIMFADTTSAIQEFLLQKKPVVTFNHTFNHDFLINIHDAEAIERAFKEALSRPQKLIHKIEQFVDDLHPYYDGKSSSRIVDSCITFLHKDKRYLKNKPLNLLRKYKIRKRLNYFTLKTYSKPFTIKP